MRRTVLALVFALFPPVFAAQAPQTPPKQASFHLSNTFVVKVPKGAKSVRIWFAVPQEDAYSMVRNFSVTSDYAVQYQRDSWENRVGYVDIENPTREQLTLKEEFDLPAPRSATASIPQTPGR